MSAKIDHLIEANPDMADAALTYRLRSIVFENSSVRVKRAKLIALADEHVTALAPLVICKVGCSHCCKISVPILEHEAVRLAEASGRTMRRLDHRTIEEVMTAGLEFVGRPCPFLLNEKCSVYASRPLVCRVHHSLNDDVSACEENVSLKPTRHVLMYDPDALEMPYAYVNHKAHSDEPWGNIAEFFPE